VSDLGFYAYWHSPEALDCGVTASNLADMATARATDVGELTVLLTSWRLHLEAANLSARTVRAYTDDAALFGRFLADKGMPTSAASIRREHVEAFIVSELERTAPSSAATRYRSLQQFFRWLAVEDEVVDPMERLRAPQGVRQAGAVFSSVELSKLDEACRGSAFAQRRDAAILAVFRSTGIRLTEMAGIRYRPDDLDHGDVDLGRREIYVRGKGGKDRIVRIDRETARRVDRYLRARAKHPRAHHERLWLGAGDRGPLTRDGIYQMIKRRGAQAGVRVYPRRFRHHFSHTWLERGGAEGDLMELNGWSSPQMLNRYGASARGAGARRSYDRVMGGQYLTRQPGPRRTALGALAARPGRQDRLAAGRRAGCAGVDSVAAEQVQRRLRQQPVPVAAAVLQVAVRRGRYP